MKHAELSFRVMKRLKMHARTMGLKDFDMRALDFNPARTQMEDGKKYRYPATLEFKVENFSNHFYSFRAKDGRWIAEGMDLNGKGLSTFRMMRRMLREMKSWSARVNPRKTNVVALRRAK